MESRDSAVTDRAEDTVTDIPQKNEKDGDSPGLLPKNFDAQIKSASPRILVILGSLGMVVSISAMVDPTTFAEAFSRPAPVVSLVLFSLALIIGVSLTVWPKDELSTFTRIDREFSQSAHLDRSIIKMRNIVSGPLIVGSVGGSEGQSESGSTESIRVDSEGLTSFEKYVHSLVHGLDEHIRRSDVKASTLLDTGTLYLRRGLYFYIASIIFWQVWFYQIGLSALVISGMISCTVAFIVIEFLAAWFLKQYRSYVDSSMAYMRVKTQFNRYLLSYYALSEIEANTVDFTNARSQLLKLISEEIKWPSLKQMQANDFNYMIESMGALNESLGKMKTIFKTDKKGRGKGAKT